MERLVMSEKFDLDALDKIPYESMWEVPDDPEALCQAVQIADSLIYEIAEAQRDLIETGMDLPDVGVSLLEMKKNVQAQLDTLIGRQGEIAAKKTHEPEL